MRLRIGGALIAAVTIAAGASGCGFGGLNSLPLPGAVGRGPDATNYHVELANVSTLEPNSPVLVDDVVVGSINSMRVRDWHADVEISVKPEVVIPANAVATVGQTSLLGSMHLALNTPLGQTPTGRLAAGATLGLNKSSTYPNTEQTLSALSVVINGGGVGQIGDIITELNHAFNGREGQIRDLLTRLNDFVGVLATQRDAINATVVALNRVAGTFAGQRDELTRALNRIPPALDVLVAERPNLTMALDKLGKFSSVATGLINETQADLVRDLHNLEPTLRSLADVGPQLDQAIGAVTAFPYGQATIDRAIRGDYLNQYIVFDFTVPRLKKGLFLGTRWGQEGAKLVPAPGDPWYATYTYDPLNAPFSPPPAAVADVTPPDPGSAALTAAVPGAAPDSAAPPVVAPDAGVPSAGAPAAPAPAAPELQLAPMDGGGH